MSNLSELESAFVLHRRPFSDTGLLVELFTCNRGRKTVMARGVRRACSNSVGLLVPFTPLLVSLYGRSEILTLKKVEANGLFYDLSGQNLVLGFYLNELLLKLLHKDEAHQNIYFFYEQTLRKIVASQNDNFKQQLALRTFELELIKELGYGLELQLDVDGNATMPGSHYLYNFGTGFLRVNNGDRQEASVFLGATILALHNRFLSKVEEFREAKCLMRLVIGALLHGKTIKARELLSV